MARQLTIPAGDTHLHAVDTLGNDPPLLFINGAFATMQTWRRVIGRLDGKYRTDRLHSGRACRALLHDHGDQRLESAHDHRAFEPGHYEPGVFEAA